MISFSNGASYSGSRLFLFGSELNPDEIDNLCQIKGDRRYKKGEKAGSTGGIRKTGMWSVGRLGDDKSFSSDFKYFIDLFDDSLMPFRKIPNVESIRLSLFIEKTENNLDFEITIDPKDIECISGIGAQLYITYIGIVDDS